MVGGSFGHGAEKLSVLIKKEAEQVGVAVASRWVQKQGSGWDGGHLLFCRSRWKLPEKRLRLFVEAPARCWG